MGSISYLNQLASMTPKKYCTKVTFVCKASCASLEMSLFGLFQVMNLSNKHLETPFPLPPRVTPFYPLSCFLLFFPSFYFFVSLSLK